MQNLVENDHEKPTLNKEQMVTLDKQIEYYVNMINFQNMPQVQGLINDSTFEYTRNDNNNAQPPQSKLPYGSAGGLNHLGESNAQPPQTNARPPQSNTHPTQLNTQSKLPYGSAGGLNRLGESNAQPPQTNAQPSQSACVSKLEEKKLKHEKTNFKN